MDVCVGVHGGTVFFFLPFFVELSLLFLLWDSYYNQAQNQQAKKIHTTIKEKEKTRCSLFHTRTHTHYSPDENKRKQKESSLFVLFCWCFSWNSFFFFLWFTTFCDDSQRRKKGKRRKKYNSWSCTRACVTLNWGCRDWSSEQAQVSCSFLVFEKRGVER